MSASTYEICRLMGGKNVYLVEKLPGPQFSVHLWEVSVSRGSTVFWILLVLVMAKEAGWS